MQTKMVALVVFMSVARPGWADVDCCTVGRPPPSLPLMRNTHVTAVAYALRFLGAALPEETDEGLAATAWVYIKGCPTCGASGVATWDVEGGLGRLLEARAAEATVEERCRYGDADVADVVFADVASAIGEDQLVLATFSYHRLARIPGVAKQRSRDCDSVAVIGVVTTGDGEYLIARDGWRTRSESPLSRDRVAPDAIGLPADGPWGEEGTGVYRWDGEYTNIVLTFVGPGGDVAGDVVGGGQ